MNSRFSLAVHVLCLLATQPEERVTSAFLAMSIGTNPVVIRRLMARLRERGLVTSKGAAGGGWMLAKPAAKVSLKSVRCALEDEVAMRMHKKQPNPKCPVGRGVHAALEDVYDKVDVAIDKAIANMTVADVLASAMGTVE